MTYVSLHTKALIDMCLYVDLKARDLVNCGVVTKVGQVASSLGIVPRVAREQHLLQGSAALVRSVNTLDWIDLSKPGH